MDVQKEYERIKKYARNAVYKDERYDILMDEVLAIRDGSADAFDMIFTAFNYGFEKGCKAASKSITA